MTLSEEIEKIKEQAWFQQLKTSYDQLPRQQQLYVKWGSFAFFIFLLFYFTYLMTDLASTTRNEYFEKRSLSEQITNASDELRRLRGQNSGFNQNLDQNWKTILEQSASSNGLNQIEVLSETPGPVQNIIQESLLEIKISNAPIKSLTQFIYSLEHGNPPVKVKGLKIEATSEDGGLTAFVVMSGYLPKPEKGEKTK